ncbi:hypothetical protein TEU_09930 [Thermococcus eurythermalis]|uniref:Uncharacterized protein n=2 Tax=Thermococcus eurythermalis TaxID=1505907 RepID=A0A097QVW9_9EURY|nr:hypothetical protein TEU_09930 [Thermococcus eurythermalis]
MSLSWVASTTNILRIVSDLDRYRVWLKKFHEIDLTNDQEVSSEIFLGYKFFFDVAFRALLDDLVSVPWFDGEDEIFISALGRGVHLNNIPNSSEHVIFLKNIWYKHLEKVLLAKDWKDLKVRLKYLNLNVLEKFFEVFKCCIVPESPYSLEKLYWLWSIDDALVRYTDTQMGYPKPYVDILVPQTSKYYGNADEYLDIVFRGYVYTLQYLWYSLIGEERDFSKIPHLDKMHIADKIFGKEIQRELYSLIPKEEKEEVETRWIELERYIKWKSLDRFFGILNENFVKKLEKTYGIMHISPNNSELFRVRCKCDPIQILKKFYRPFPEPSFMESDKRKSYEDWKRYLDVEFLWLPLDTLSSAGGGTFNGAAAFIYLLSGLCEFKKKQRATNPTKVLRIKHPEDIGHRISYALLVESFGQLYNPPGWIVFYEVGTDFSGTGGSWYYEVEDVIKKYGKMLEVRDVVVPEEIFRKYLLNESVREVSNEYFQIESLKKRVLEYESHVQRLHEAMSSYRGLLPELLVYYLLSSGELPIKKFKDIKWRVTLGGEEIDILALDEDEVPWIFECKFNTHKEEFASIVDQLKRKKEQVEKAYKRTPVLYLVFLANKNQYELSYFEKYNINVLVLERELRKYLDINTIEKLLVDIPSISLDEIHSNLY